MSRRKPPGRDLDRLKVDVSPSIEAQADDLTKSELARIEAEARPTPTDRIVDQHLRHVMALDRERQRLIEECDQ